jgi:tetratricopeptide (TPR) repeat protein
VQLSPHSAEARNNLGANYLARKLPAQAAAEFEKASIADPSKASAWVNLGTARLQLADYPRAIRALERARTLEPADTQIALALAEARLRAGQTEAAIAELRDPRLAPASSALLMEAAQRSTDQKNYSTAVTLLEALESSHQNSAEWNSMIGYAYFRSERMEPALEHLQTAIRLAPDAEDYYLELSEALGANNAVPAALQVLEAAQIRLPRSVKIRTGLGVTYVMLGEYPKAETFLNSVLEEKPDYEIAYKVLAECYDTAAE